MTRNSRYWCSIRKIGAIYKLKYDHVWSNVLSVLHRIAIITISYQMVIGLLTLLLVGSLGFALSKDMDSTAFMLTNLLPVMHVTVTVCLVPGSAVTEIDLALLPRDCRH